MGHQSYFKIWLWFAVGMLALQGVMFGQDFTNDPPSARNARMQWWREARFGMFIHPFTVQFFEKTGADDLEVS